MSPDESSDSGTRKGKPPADVEESGVAEYRLEEKIWERNATLRMYHTAPSSLRYQIKEEGLVGGKGGGFSSIRSDRWEDEIYETTPLYLSVEPGRSYFMEWERDGTDVWQVLIQIESLVADLPSLLDAGWTQAVSDGGMDRIGTRWSFDDLLRPGSAAVRLAIEDAGSAATFRKIDPDQLQVFS